jgi:hypothetical protein
VPEPMPPDGSLRALTTAADGPIVAVGASGIV